MNEAPTAFSPHDRATDEMFAFADERFLPRMGPLLAENSQMEHNSIGEICLPDSERDCELTGNTIKPVASLRLFVMAWLHV